MPEPQVALTPAPASAVRRAELSRYSRQLLVPEFAETQPLLKAARVLVVGAGGLGCPVITYLAGAGVGELRIADGDKVSLSNLHRQTLYTTPDVGRPKAEVAAARAQQLNPWVKVEPGPALTPQTAAALLSGVTLVIDATDNFESRYLIHDLCQARGLLWVWGAASGTSGMASVFGPQLGLREVFPVPSEEESCQTVGVFGPLLGVVGGVMAGEALKVLSHQTNTLRFRLWTYDALSQRTRTLQLRAPVLPTP